LKREAAAKGTTPEALTTEEIEKKTPEPSDQDIQKVYDENKSQLGGQTLEQVKPRIVQYLKGQKQEERHSAYIEERKKKYPTTVSRPTSSRPTPTRWASIARSSTTVSTRSRSRWRSTRT